MLALLLLPSAGLAATDAFSFRPRVDYGAWTAPWHLALGDVNHDGFADMAVANSGVSTVTLRLGAGDGTFLGLLYLVVGTSPRWVTFGDLNQDGNLDLVSANTGNATASVLLGNGDGTFAPKVDYMTYLSPTSAIVEDMTGDGHPDLVVGSFGSGGYVEILPGDGTGALGTRIGIAVGGAPWAMAAADLNADGVLDLVVADHGAPGAKVLLGTGGGSFAQPVGYSTPTPPWSVTVGDVNADGRPDFVTANDGSPTLSVYTGEGDGVFASRDTVSCGSYPYSVAIGDLDGDGIVDLAATNDVSNTLTLLPGLGDGTFGSGTSLPVPRAPISVALEDLDRNGSPDVVLANYGSQSSSVFLNDLRGTVPTAVALAVEPASSSFGEVVTLTATVDPDTAAGVVEFYDDGTLVGAAELSRGVTHVDLADLLHREHPFWARYAGSAVHMPGTSDIVSHQVALAGTSVLLEPSVAAALQYVKVRFQATVSPTPPGTGTPAGSVVFRTDGAPLGSPAPLVSGIAVSDSFAFTSRGDHEVSAEYVPPDTLRYAGSSATIGLPVATAGPVIAAVRDVPNDQGGKVFLTWRCAIDEPGTRVISGYRVWRRVPTPPAASATHGADRPLLRRVVGPNASAETFWEAVAELPSAALVSYGYTAATTQDSIEGSNPYTAFFVQALTRDPDAWLDSDPDSGYSVDNLSPAHPSSFAAEYGAEQVALHWGPARDADFREFRLYRGDHPMFEPGPASLILAGPDTGFVDVTDGVWHVYKLAAVDLHGNTSRVAVVQPEQPVAALASLVRADATANRIDLTWYAGGNAGLPARVERRTAALDWSAVGHVLADGDGFLRYTDADIVPGTRYGYRLAIIDGEVETFAGATWVTAADPELALAGAWPNPLTGGPLRVGFSLPSGGPARIELLDVAGRRIVAREVGSLGAGRHEVLIPETTGLPAGVYHLRFSRGSWVATRRVVMIH